MFHPISTRWDVPTPFILPPGAFRLLLAVLVFASHSSRLDVGRFGVVLFFALSGYWTTKVFVSEYRCNAWQFLASRIWRLAPLYLCGLFIAAALTGSSVNAGNLILFGVATTKADPTGVSWSLDLEMQFYAALPFILLVWDRMRSPAFTAFCIALTAAGWALYLGASIRLFALFLPAFLAGMLLARTDWQPNAGTVAGSLGLFAAVTLALVLTPFGLAHLDKTIPNIIDVDVFSMLWAALLLPYVAASLHRPSSKFDRDVGNLSYPFYLVHYAAIAAAAHLMPGLIGKIGAGVLSLAVAALLLWLVDKPSEKWRKQRLRQARADRSLETLQQVS